MVLMHWDSGRWTRLLAVVELLGEVTADVQTLGDIPKVLTAVLPAEWASFRLTRQGDSGEMQTVVAAQCRRNAEGKVQEDQSAPEGAGLEDGRVEIAREIDARYRMVLALRKGNGWEGTTEQWNEMVEMVGETLLRSLRTLVAWREQPGLLGGNFTEMTGAQWRVARLLGTDLSEKQLAHDLNISPHTLHCYVKAIYRKLGVRNRMGAVQLLDQAARQYRMRSRKWSGESVAVEPASGEWSACGAGVEVGHG
jgi:DNA-binding CsgD family transcriptional regulator